jgi:hypothetical protein
MVWKRGWGKSGGSSIPHEMIISVGQNQNQPGTGVAHHVRPFLRFFLRTVVSLSLASALATEGANHLHMHTLPISRSPKRGVFCVQAPRWPQSMLEDFPPSLFLARLLLLGPSSASPLLRRLFSFVARSNLIASRSLLSFLL